MQPVTKWPNPDELRKDMEEFFSKKYPEMHYLAYFQSYTNTYSDVDNLRALYEEALRVNKVVGLVISTRPDCVSDAILDLLEELSKKTFILLEFGLESTKDKTLEYINRCHTYAESVDAIKRAAARGLNVGAHLILGLPGERSETIQETIRFACDIDPDTIQVSIAAPYPGTELFRQAIQREQDVLTCEIIDGTFLRFGAEAFEGGEGAVVGPVIGVDLAEDFHYRVARAVDGGQEGLADQDVIVGPAFDVAGDLAEEFGLDAVIALAQPVAEDEAVDEEALGGALRLVLVVIVAGEGFEFGGDFAGDARRLGVDAGGEGVAAAGSGLAAGVR